MDKNYKTFEEENDEILEFILEDKFFRFFDKEYDEIQERFGTSIELYITASCNQKCEYCYLVSNGDKLYPKEIRNAETIIKNLNILLSYIKERNLYVKNIDLFSGEIWGTKLGDAVLGTILDYVKNGLEINHITIPTNCSFITKKESIDKMQNFIDEFKENKTRLMLSASVDGLLIESETRPYKNESSNVLRNEDFYHNLFVFCSKNSYGMHPMVSAYSIEKWIDNFDWWMGVFDKYKFDFFQHIMFLEVRNDDWTREKIIYYLKFLDHVVEYFFKNVYKDKKEILFRVFGVNRQNEGPTNYNITSMRLSGKIHGCSVDRSLCVRLGDLAISPCHRLSYNKLLYGKFVVKDDKIIGVKANNIQMANNILYTSSIYNPECDSCAFNDSCLRGCFGSQYENTKDPFYPIKSVCDLFKAKNVYFIEKYTKMGLFEYLKDNTDFISVSILKSVKKIKETKEYNEWKEIVKTII